GVEDAILIDGSFTLADAHRVIGAILDSGKNLTTVYVTHWHPDHYFGLVATPETVAEIRKTWKGKVKQWGPMYGANLTATPVIPTPIKDKTLTLEGQTLEIHGMVQG